MISRADDPRPIRTAVIGYGLGGRVFHTPLIAADPAYELVAIVTGDPTRADEARSRYGAGIVVPDADALFAGAEALGLGLVVVTSPNATHAPLAHRALDAGLDVVVDKPFALTADDARDVREHAEAVGRQVTVFQNRRWDGDFLTVRSLLASGDLGEARQFDSAFEVWKPALGPKRWKDGAPPAEGGGILFDLGPHLIDQALQLFGEVDVEGGGVHAELDRRRPGAVAADEAFVSLAHRSGVRSRLWMSAVAPAPRPRFRVVGSAAVLTIEGLDPQEAQLAAGLGQDDPGFGTNPDRPDGTLASPEGSRAVPIEAGRFGSFYRELADALRSGRPVPVDPRESEQVLRIIEEAHRQQG